MERPWAGFIWIICGVVAVLTGSLRKVQEIAEHDAVGYNAALLPPIVWALCYLWSTVYFLFGIGGQPSALLGLLVWTLVTAYILVIAGWPEG